MAPILTPDSVEMDRLCDRLRDLTVSDDVAVFPEEALRACGRAGVFRWFLSEQDGGYGWSPADQTRGYLRLAAADLTTTFVITQRMGACRRIAASENRSVAQRWLPSLLAGESFATVGISHLTTSRQHLGRPALAAHPEPQVPGLGGNGYRLEGFSPWVTGAAHADLLVVGASAADGTQILAAVPCDQDAVRPAEPIPLVALSSSCTGRVDFSGAVVPAENILAGPVADVMRTGQGGNTGGLQTSTLAIGLARAAADYLLEQAAGRAELADVAGRLDADVSAAERRLLDAAEGHPNCDLGELRGQANRLVLRATQAALTAAKGAGFVADHPVGRWCREALFFLVWSCPQPVAQAHLCELVGLQ
ncbi:acyl-CoA dehydrogenase family protein [Roseimaritima sediminicola]|uniref:acyl-CoA dehydrogenase family protein n=1 Tax=Roseimaritima sediminicola TaxID=2662066 RepID=UPI0012982A25|nr:acyl-CoA dehydrogenase family protein [Roseimaritima sediminicola]